MRAKPSNVLAVKRMRVRPLVDGALLCKLKRPWEVTMKRFIFIAATLFLASCATAHQEQSAGHERPAKKGAVTNTANSHGDTSDHIVRGQIFGGVLGALAGAVLDKERDDRINPSEERFHRSSCSNGDEYFGRARYENDLDVRITLMEEGIDYCPDNPAAHNDLGLALMLWGDMDAARMHFNDALRLDPDYNPARINLSRMGYDGALEQRDEQAGDEQGGSGSGAARPSQQRLIEHERSRKEHIERREKWDYHQNKLREKNSAYN
ncbi:MAG: hypothetical protein AUJ57_01300 [Zetaproteobacteria bacterium CG1_02_53_45]|nr:MAG: hypothetical protein AUJ57_01300 [Zetaproteobacteria bacterium CG1_02_53_45]